MPKISDLPTDTAPEAADLFPFVDTSASRTEVVTLTNLAASAPFTAAYVTVPTTWAAPTFTNSWVDYGGSFQVVQYRKVGDSVQIRGLMKTGTVGSSAFTLPVGFRPPAIVNFVTISNSALGEIEVATTGDVRPSNGSNVWFSFAGVSFSVMA